MTNKNSKINPYTKKFGVGVNTPILLFALLAPYARHRLVVLGLFCTLIFAFCIFAVNAANAATLYFSPSSGNFTVGNILNMSVLVDTQGQAINNSSAVINFPTDLLEVISVSKSGSLFSLWVEEPAFSNSAGAISFDGGLPTPGYDGSAGRLLNITFRVRNAGTALLVFSSGAVRANDGYGTDILQTRSQAQFNLISEAKPVAPPLPVFGTPQAPGISSSTHPDSNTWYALDDAKFTWELSSGITGARLLVGRIPNAIPTVTYIPAIRSREFDNLDDGIWYFSVQLRNNAGWGAISRFRFQIDTEPPQLFETTVDNGGDPTNPTPILHFKALDNISGLEFYEIRVGENKDIIPVKVAKKVVSNPYTLPLQLPGEHTVVIKALDFAGNETLSAIDVVIEPLETPVIIDGPHELASGEPLVVHGSTYPDSKVNIWLQREKEDTKRFVTESDRDGKFTFIADERLNDGIYKLWAEVIDARGARSLPTEKITIAVAKSAILQIGSWAVSLLAVVIPLVALIFVLLFIIWYGWHKFASFRKKLRNLRQEVREAESALHRAFDMLKEDIREQVKLLEKTKTKRQLTKEEEKVIEQLRRDLDDAERFVRKEIEDIEKNI